MTRLLRLYEKERLFFYAFSACQAFGRLFLGKIYVFLKKYPFHSGTPYCKVINVYVKYKIAFVANNEAIRFITVSGKNQGKIF